MLVEAAPSAAGGDIRHLSHGAIANGELRLSVDLVVCNFALLGKECVEGLVRAAASLLTPRGSLIVQTLHPLQAGGELPYRDGWREASWDGFCHGIFHPYPWYFRTLESWMDEVVIAFSNITAAKKVEAQLWQTQPEMEKRVKKGSP